MLRSTQTHPLFCTSGRNEVFKKTYTKALIFLHRSGKYLTSQLLLFRTTGHGWKLPCHPQIRSVLFSSFYSQRVISHLAAKLQFASADVQICRYADVQIPAAELRTGSRITGNGASAVRDYQHFPQLLSGLGDLQSRRVAY